LKTRSLGICLGASTIKVVELVQEQEQFTVAGVHVRSHESNPRAVFADLIKELDAPAYDNLMLTGRKFRDMVNARSITEPEAVEQALAFTEKAGTPLDGYRAVASLGAETFLVYQLDGGRSISSVETGNKCASGTGEFFLQQIGRMNIGVEEAVRLATDTPAYRVSGRCSVFCKSDCTHALNKGIPIGRVTAGLCRMMGEKILDLLEKVHDKKIIALGGVTRNLVVMDFVKQRTDRLLIPAHAEVFEALGAAYYAARNRVGPQLDAADLFRHERHSFTSLPPIRTGESLVRFMESKPGTARSGDECLIGLDVGSTTTKGVVLRKNDDAMLASVYLRTNGNPVGASRACYAGLSGQLTAKVAITGLAVTGSGRQIAGLHAGTDAIINEIIAHATGAAYFDKEVDTIFEIGGQDAKYTFLTNAVASDYAMNEACSAGTGSFLEESAHESLGIDCRDIQTIALQADTPPNFNDQCAAFIGSDIKTATHEGVGLEDITAGLVYSICMNYVNRVKGQRRAGKKIFMQGGVCYNRAVPLAMANLIEREIVVPPDPGLIGAFGVALELKHRIASGLVSLQSFDLDELAQRDIEYGASFVCHGGPEKCDRGCEINMMIIDGRKYPFGGACNKYYNLAHHIDCESSGLDLVRVRQEMALSDSHREQTGLAAGPTVGLSRSFLVNTLFPLYHEFFTRLGARVVLPDTVDPEGVKKRRSSFCFPGEIAHGFFANLLNKAPDYIFLPKIMALPADNPKNASKQYQSTCVLLQSEAYYLTSSFRDMLPKARLLSPLLDFSAGYGMQERAFVRTAEQMGFEAGRARQAYTAAVARQRAFAVGLKEQGRRILTELESEQGRWAVVLFGRPYNAFTKEANKGIPTKFASRGRLIIPWDMLPIEQESCDPDMCWAIGKDLLKAAQYVKKHPQLFGAWITNFSCGPDSFLVGMFRDIMKAKPSLTLELDSHTADAGVNTRVEAFIDIVGRYRQLGKRDDQPLPFTPAKVTFRRGIPHFVTSGGHTVSFRDPRVHLVIPSMGRMLSEVGAAAFKGLGVRATALPVYDFEALKLGRAHASCKECLPLLLTSGGLLKHLKYRSDPEELLAYFMVFTPGNCRFPQYRVFLRSLIEKQRLENVTLFSLTAEKGYLYQGFSGIDRLSFIKAFIVSDVMEDIKNALAVLALDPQAASEEFERQWSKIIGLFERAQSSRLYRALEEIAAILRAIPLRRPFSKAKKVSLMGEIFVRRDYFSCQDLLQRLARRDIIVKRVHFFEWLKYVDHIIRLGVYEPNFDFKSMLQFHIKLFVQQRYEERIKRILAGSGLYEYEPIDVGEILEYGKQFFDVEFRGESILIAGDFFKEILHSTHGVISIGPFACMPTRVIEAVLSAESTMDTKRRIDAAVTGAAKDYPAVTSLPFLAVETDGNPFPQVIEARIEAFCLQVERVHERMQAE
jgi:predicted CoA-substrate-specific enzyme activase